MKKLLIALFVSSQIGIAVHIGHFQKINLNISLEQQFLFTLHVISMNTF